MLLSFIEHVAPPFCMTLLCGLVFNQGQDSVSQVRRKTCRAMTWDWQTSVFILILHLFPLFYIKKIFGWQDGEGFITVASQQKTGVSSLTSPPLVLQWTKCDWPVCPQPHALSLSFRHISKTGPQTVISMHYFRDVLNEVQSMFFCTIWW